MKQHATAPLAAVSSTSMRGAFGEVRILRNLLC